MRPVALAAPLLILAFAGCLQDSFDFGPSEVGPNSGWPPASKADLRPGAQLFVPLTETASAQCTAAFLFASADNETLYLSFSAHCLGEGPDRKSLGADVMVKRGSNFVHIGDVAFDGWAKGESLSRDFALVAIRNYEGARDRTHPSVMHWGGPTGVADSSTLLPGTAVLAYGASSQRELNSPDNVKTGRFLFDDSLAVGFFDGDQLVVRLDPPSVQGDSGAPLMLSNGLAAGVLSQGGSTVVPNSDFSLFVPVDEMLDLVNQSPGLEDVRIVTWQMPA